MAAQHGAHHAQRTSHRGFKAAIEDSRELLSSTMTAKPAAEPAAAVAAVACCGCSAFPLPLPTVQLLLPCMLACIWHHASSGSLVTAPSPDLQEGSG